MKIIDYKSGKMKFTGRISDRDDHNYEYKEHMELAKLGRMQSGGRTCPVHRDSDSKPRSIRKSSRNSRIQLLHDQMAPSTSDSYRNRSDLCPKAILVRATSSTHCRNLMRILGKGDELLLTQILTTLSSLPTDRIMALTTHYIGCHFVRKLLHVGSEAQGLTLVKIVTKKPLQLINISCNSHGKGVVQKMIQMFKSLPSHINVLLANLEHDTLRLTIDRQGQSVVYCCLRFLDSVQCIFIFETVLLHFMTIIGGNKSSDGFGGGIMIQCCLRKAPKGYRQRLLEKFADYALPLSRDPIGHYLLLDLLSNSKWSDTSRKVLSKLEGNFADLAMQNISSKVVKECLIISSSNTIGVSMDCVIRELIHSPLFPNMHQNIHAQSVIQSACSLSGVQSLEDLNAALGNALVKT